MAEVSSGNPNELGYTLLRHDIPEELVDAVLDQQREHDIFFRFSLVNWDALQKRPNLKHFIAASSFEAAPEDPIMREKVTSSLLGMLALLDEAVKTEELEELFTKSV
ncbi:hypothetical protein H0X10_03320 [Candidatus Saccharibacteria bacterium]|nr:hypothetical protein [Candidatus Saccharibacteria bacterium]